MAEDAQGNNDFTEDINGLYCRPVGGLHTAGRQGCSGLGKTQILRNGKRKHFAYFKKKLDAAKARDTTARELHGEYTVLDFPKL